MVRSVHREIGQSEDSCPKVTVQWNDRSGNASLSRKDNYMCLKQRGWFTPSAWGQLERLAQDRDAWRALAGSLCSSRVCLLVGCLASQQQASVSQRRICSDKFTCCHTEIEVADQTFYLTQSQYTDTWPTSPSADAITPGDGRVATGVPIFKSLVWLDPEKIPAQAGFEPGIFRSRGGRLTTRPARRSLQ